MRYGRKIEKRKEREREKEKRRKKVVEGWVQVFSSSSFLRGVTIIPNSKKISS